MTTKLTAKLAFVLALALLTSPAARLNAQADVVTGSDPQPGQPSLSTTQILLPILIAAATS